MGTTRWRRLVILIIAAVVVLSLLGFALSFLLFELGGEEPSLRR